MIWSGEATVSSLLLSGPCSVKNLNGEAGHARASNGDWSRTKKKAGPGRWHYLPIDPPLGGIAERPPWTCALQSERSPRRKLNWASSGGAGGHHVVLVLSGIPGCARWAESGDKTPRVFSAMRKQWTGLDDTPPLTNSARRPGALTRILLCAQAARPCLTGPPPNPAPTAGEQSDVKPYKRARGVPQDQEST